VVPAAEEPADDAGAEVRDAALALAEPEARPVKDARVG
jgi:hypothetical protein